MGVRINAEQFLKRGQDPPGTRHELVHGDIVVCRGPSREHAFISRELSFILLGHIREHNLGDLVGDEDTVFDEFNVRRPDMIFISKARTRLRDRKRHGIRFAPDLCVEIVSPGAEVYDQKDKSNLYAEHDVAHSWIVDSAERTFTAYKLLRNRYVQTAAGRDHEVISAPPFPDLKIPLKQIWPHN